jgi:CRP-like cAMP-binding protein
MRVEPYLEMVKLPQGKVLCEAGSPLGSIYFPQTCVLSLLAVAENGSTVETASVGREGAFGLPTGMYTQVSFSRCVVLLEGSALRIQTDRLKAEFARSEAARTLFMRYSELLVAQIQQAAACNALHPTGARLCRWLLMMHDRAETDTMALTHELLAGVLGANRSTVTMAAGALQSLGLISYRRGKISILDRPELERAACECYAVTRRWNERLNPSAH